MECQYEERAGEDRAEEAVCLGLKWMLTFWPSSADMSSPNIDAAAMASCKQILCS
jgi:hypothetical protein